MTFHPDALYLDLLEDLSDYLPYDYEAFKPYRHGMWPGISTQQAAALALADTFLKKFVSNVKADADDKALEKFLHCNETCSNWSLELESESDSLLYGTFINEVHKFFYRKYNSEPILSNVRSIMDLSTTGPGASIGAYGKDFYTKLFASPMACTSRALYRYYTDYYCKIPHYSRAENKRYCKFGDPIIVDGNRISFVKKNDDISRVICTEPLLNMLYQQGVRFHLERRIRQCFGIDFADQQDYNRELARVGSRDNSFVTIDLSSASDTVALSMIKSVLPREFFTWLDIGRSPKCQLLDGSWVRLDMISSMGNAFTFPLETMLFACVVSSVYQVLDIPLLRRRPSFRSRLGCREHPRLDGACAYCKRAQLDRETGLGNYGVFGDDIIVVPEAAGAVVRLLSILGFSVNEDKSFFEGPFRESCGGDYFNGHPIRPFHLERLDTQEARYVAINRLNEWSAMTGIPVPRAIRRLLRKTRYLPVPLHENDDAGIKVPFDTLRRPDLDRNSSYIYKRWAVRPKTIRIVDGDLKVPRSERKRYFNEYGLFVAFLRGDIRGDSMTVRLDSPRYSPKVALTPGWDYVPTVGANALTGKVPLAEAIRSNINWNGPQGA